jgi:hypothetical protein
MALLALAMQVKSQPTAGHRMFGEMPVDFELGSKALPVVLKSKLLGLPYLRRLPSIRFHHIPIEVVYCPTDSDSLKMRGVFYSNFHQECQSPGQGIAALLVAVEPGLADDAVQHLLECRCLLRR